MWLQPKESADFLRAFGQLAFLDAYQRSGIMSQNGHRQLNHRPGLPFVFDACATPTRECFDQAFEKWTDVSARISRFHLCGIGDLAQMELCLHGPYHLGGRDGRHRINCVGRMLTARMPWSWRSLSKRASFQTVLDSCSCP